MWPPDFIITRQDNATSRTLGYIEAKDIGVKLDDIEKTNQLTRYLASLNNLILTDYVEFRWYVNGKWQKTARLGTVGKHTLQEYPIVHFYEIFLAAYDPKLREKRGVYYTPESVVSFMVRSVDVLLTNSFQREQGLADPNTLILDPATGTATFLYAIIQLIHERLVQLGQGGLWSAYVEEQLLTRLFGFELLMAPYAIAHLKLSLLLQETGYRFSAEKRLGVYLINTLEEAITSTETLPLGKWISDEANAAAAIKRDKPIMVVIGNPPYSGHSANKSLWIINLLNRAYKVVDAQKLDEKNPISGAHEQQSIEC